MLDKESKGVIMSNSNKFCISYKTKQREYVATTVNNNRVYWTVNIEKLGSLKDSIPVFNIFTAKLIARNSNKNKRGSGVYSIQKIDDIITT